MTEISYLYVVLAGLLSFLSPCVLPIVPGYLCFMAGTSLDKLQLDEGDEIKKKVFSFSLSFVLGFSTIFVILGASATLLSSIVYEYLDFLRIVGGIIIIIFGIHFMQIIQIPFLNREMRYQIESYRPGIVGSYVIGLSFAFGWTPCIGPILGSILVLASTTENIYDGIILLSFYSLGLAIPFILAGYLMQKFLLFSKNIKKKMKFITRTGGILLLLTGILIMTNQLQIIGFYLLESLPFLQNFG